MPVLTQPNCLMLYKIHSVYKLSWPTSDFFSSSEATDISSYCLHSTGMFIGLDAAGKTTALYQLKLGEVVTTIPTVGKLFCPPFHLKHITLDS